MKKKSKLAFSDLIRVNIFFGFMGAMIWLEFHRYMERSLAKISSLPNAAIFQDVLMDIINFDKSSFIVKSATVCFFVNICFLFALKKSLHNTTKNIFDSQNDLYIILLEFARVTFCCYCWVISDKKSSICLMFLVFLMIISLIRFDVLYKSWKLTLLIASVTLLFSALNWYYGYTLASYGDIESSKNVFFIFITNYSFYINVLFVLLMPCILLIEKIIASRWHDFNTQIT